MELKDGDIYENKSNKIQFTLRQETPVTWSLNWQDVNDYPIYPEEFMKDLLEKNFRRVESE